MIPDSPKRRVDRAWCLLVWAATMMVCAGCDTQPISSSSPASSTNEIEFNRETPRIVILIILDTFRRDHIGFYNPRNPFTPNLDHLSRESIVFDSMYAASPWTRSSIASVFSSRYPTQIRLETKKDSIAQEVVTVAEVFRDHGYETHGLNTNGNAGPDWGFGQGFDYYGPPTVPGWKRDPDGPRFPADLVTDSALRWLDSLESDARAFLHVLYVDAHDPYYVYRDLMNRDQPPGRVDSTSREDLNELDRLDRQAGERARRDRERIRYAYESEVRYLDHSFGRFIKGLQDAGIYDECMIVVTADHGEELWDHGHRDHGTSLFDEMVRVPLIIRYPNSWKIRPERVSTAAGHVDVAPTMLAAIGANTPPSFVGTDLYLLLTDPKLRNANRHAYTEMDRRGLDLEAISDGKNKVIRRRSAQGSALRLPTSDPPQHQYFDLVDDPRERSPTFSQDNRDHTSLLDRLSVMASANERRRIIGSPNAPAEISESTIENLKELGYVR